MRIGRDLISSRPLSEIAVIALAIAQQLEASRSAGFLGNTIAGASSEVLDHAEIGVAATESGRGIPISIERIHNGVRVHLAGTYIVAFELDARSVAGLRCLDCVVLDHRSLETSRLHIYTGNPRAVGIV